MSENNERSVLSKPKQMLTNALHAVRGDNTQQLIESFTSEMTLVAEGLCDDQSRLRKSVEEVRRESEHDRQGLQDALDMLDRTISENQKEMDRRMMDLGQRLDALEKGLQKKKEHHLGRVRLPGGFMSQLILLVSIVAGSWVLVTILNLFR
ncbi:MAG: hypothetical protein IJI38_07715 [Clostridia bacterium]|nr:hypothetical protein [Clostridia bacterium]